MPVGTLDTKRLPAGSVLGVGAGLAGLYLALNGWRAESLLQDNNGATRSRPCKI